MEGIHTSGGAASPATSGRPGTAGESYKRKRSGAEFESSPGTGGDGEGEEEEESKKRQPGVKRACNECRQQKVSLNVNVGFLIGRLQRCSCEFTASIVAENMADVLCPSFDAMLFKTHLRSAHVAID